MQIQKEGRWFSVKNSDNRRGMVFHYDFQKSYRMNDPGLVCCYFRTDEEVKVVARNWLRT